MPIAIACQHCDWKGKVKDELAGKKGKCPTCGELVPIPNTPGGKRASADDEPDVVDEADFVEESPRPRGKPKSKSLDEAFNSVGRDDDDRPRARRRDDDEDNDRPRSRRRDDDADDDRPRRRRSDDDDDRPSRSRRGAADDNEEEDDRPRSRRRPADDDESQPRRRRFPVDDDDEPRPRRRKRPRRRESSGGPNMGMVVGSSILLVIMIVWFVVGLVFFDLCFYWPPIGSVLAIIGIIRGLMGAKE
jgi:hypothetical protein